MHKPPSPPTKNLIGLRVRQARERPSVHLSQVGLSACLAAGGLSLCRTAVSKIESQERCVTDYELVKLAKCLHVSTAWLLGETNSYQGRRRSR